MTASRALAIVAVIGVAIFALSFVNGWIVHDREIRGEGYRHSEILLSAWRSVAAPVLSAGAVVALATAVAAVVRLTNLAAVPAWLLAAGAVVSLAALATSVVPLGWDGHTTSIDLRPAILTWVGLGLATVMLAAVAVAAPAGMRAWAILGVVGAAVLVGGVAGRQVVLTASGPSNQNWSDGTYALDGAEASLTLVIADGRYQLGERWAGAWEGSGGWTVALDDDPACPDARGAYHAHGEGPDGTDLRFVRIVDTCDERSELLESGSWARQP
jgi:hypothetical protein